MSWQSAGGAAFMKDNISDIATSCAAFTRFRGLYHNEGYVGYMVFRVTIIRQPYYHLPI